MDMRSLFLLSENIRTLHEKIGNAVWQIQVLEQMLAYLINIISPQEISSLEKAEEILELSYRKTLGQLISQMKKSNLPIPKDFEEDIDKFLDDRNWLMHRIQRLHDTDIQNADKFKKLLNRIDNIASEAMRLSNECANISTEYNIKIGIKQEEITKLANDLLQKWENDSKQA